MAVGEAVLAAVPWRHKLLYARVDLVPDDDGRPCVIELELADCSVFIDQDVAAADRFAAAIAGL